VQAFKAALFRQKVMHEWLARLKLSFHFADLIEDIDMRPPSEDFMRLCGSRWIGGGHQDRIHDVLVTGAPAQIARNRLTDFHLGRMWVFLQEWNEGHQNPRRAVPALQSMRFPKSVLQGMQLVGSLCQPLHGSNRVPVGLNGKHQAGTSRFAIKQYRAGAAHPVLTADVSAG
jgi:hypothetical protein